MDIQNLNLQDETERPNSEMRVMVIKTWPV